MNRARCVGTYRNGPGKRFARCQVCGGVDYEANEGDHCKRAAVAVDGKGNPVCCDRYSGNGMCNHGEWTGPRDPDPRQDDQPFDGPTRFDR